MKWTNEKPTETGYYWMKKPEDYPTVVFVSLREHKLIIWDDEILSFDNVYFNMLNGEAQK